METIEKELELCIKIDEKTINELSSKITQKNIITTVQSIKQQLLDSGMDKEKIFNIYDVAIEMLQNILKYSYGNKIDENKKREADGKFTLSYDSSTQEVIICSCNLISSSQVETIKQRVDEVKGLNEKELRKLLRTKMKSKRDGHANGAGLGFATIATKTSKPICVEFENILEGVVKYRLEVAI
jgi:UDP-N-acetylglucosamine 2-epimerase